MTTSSSTQPSSSAPRSHDDNDATEPVRHAQTSGNAALLWVLLIVISFLATLAILFSFAAGIP